VSAILIIYAFHKIRRLFGSPVTIKYSKSSKLYHSINLHQLITRSPIGLQWLSCLACVLQSQRGALCNMRCRLLFFQSTITVSATRKHRDPPGWGSLSSA